MNVVDAVKIAKEGKYITRKYYKNYGYVFYLTSLNVFFIKDQDVAYCFKYNDFIAEDWEVVE
jgi:hypothetical protein